MATAKKAAKHTPRGLKQDRERLNISQPYEVNYEANKLKTTPAAVKKAAKAVGPTRKAIEKKLKK